MTTHNDESSSSVEESYTLSALGEAVVAKALGTQWKPSTDKGEHEPVGGYEVRTRPNQNDELIIRPEDSDDATFALVVRITERTFG